MTVERKPPSGLLKFGFKIPMWFYRAHLGYLFGGRIIALVHHGRTSGKRYVSGLEILDRHEGELFVFSAWGRKADWYRNIEVGGIDELWDGRDRYGAATFRVVDVEEAYDVLARYEVAHPRTARQTLTHMMPGYDFSDAMRRELAEVAVIVAFTPATAE